MPSVCGMGHGDCRTGHGTLGCDDQGTGCCAKVCACDPSCCEVEWDQHCAEAGVDGNGCGAAHLCETACGGDGTKVLGWAGPPFRQGQDNTGGFTRAIARLNAAPHYESAWPMIDLSIEVGDCAISPGHVYLLDTVFEGADLGIMANYSESLVEPTAALYGDVAGATIRDPLDGLRNFRDITATVWGFQNQPSGLKVWVDLQGQATEPQVPMYAGDGIDFLDIFRAIQGFQGGTYYCDASGQPTGFCEPWDCRHPAEPCWYPCP